MTSMSLPAIAVLKGDGKPTNQVLHHAPIAFSGEAILATDLLKCMIMDRVPHQHAGQGLVDLAFDLAERLYRTAHERGHTVAQPPISAILPGDSSKWDHVSPQTLRNKPTEYGAHGDMAAAVVD